MKMTNKVKSKPFKFIEKQNLVIGLQNMFWPTCTSASDQRLKRIEALEKTMFYQY